MSKCIATDFKAKCKEIIPNYNDDFDAIITDDMSAQQIDAAAFSQSEYLGGMAVVILALIEKADP